MAKGVVAFYMVVGLILAISLLAGGGFYEELGLQYDDSANAQVQSAVDTFTGQEATDRSGGSVLQDFTTSAGTTLAAGWEVIKNLSGVLQMLGVPKIVADPLQTVFLLTFSITFAAFIRGVVLQ